MSRKQPAQRLVAAEEQQAEHTHSGHVMAGLHCAERLRELEIRQLDEARIASSLTLAHEAAEALEFERVEILPASVRQRERGMIEQAAIGLVRLHLVEVHRHACRSTVAAKRPAHVLSIRRPDRRAGGRHSDDYDVLSVDIYHVDSHRQRRPCPVRYECL